MTDEFYDAGAGIGEFDFDALRRSTRNNYKTGAVFNALANAIRGGVDDDTELLDMATKVDRKFDERYPRHD